MTSDRRRDIAFWLRVARENDTEVLAKSRYPHGLCEHLSRERDRKIGFSYEKDLRVFGDWTRRREQLGWLSPSGNPEVMFPGYWWPLAPAPGDNPNRNERTLAALMIAARLEAEIDD